MTVWAVQVCQHSSKIQNILNFLTNSISLQTIDNDVHARAYMILGGTRGVS